MPINLNFNQTNQSIERMNQFLQMMMMQGMIGQRGQREALLEDVLQRGRQTAAFSQAKEMEGIRAAATAKQALTNAMLEYGKTGPGQNLMSIAQMDAIPDLPPQYRQASIQAKQKLGEILPKLADMMARVHAGVVDPAGLTDALAATTPEDTIKILNEAGQNQRAFLMAGTERARINMETGKTSQTQENLISGRWIDDLTHVQDFLKSQGIKDPNSAWSDSIRAALATQGSFPDPMSPENRGYALRELEKIKHQVLGGQLPDPEQQRFITLTMDTFKFQGGKSGAAGPVPSSTVVPEGQQVTRRMVPTAGPEAGAPPGAPSPSGITPGDQAAAQRYMRQSLIDVYTEKFLKRVYPQYYDTANPMDPAMKTSLYNQAIQAATEFVDQLQAPAKK